MTLASVLKLPPEKVTINRTLLGGGFGRRSLVDFVLQAALFPEPSASQSRSSGREKRTCSMMSIAPPHYNA